MLAPGADRLLDRRAPSPGAKFHGFPIGQADLHPATRRDSIRERLQALGDGSLALLPGVAFSLAQADLVGDVGNDLAHVAAGALLEEGGADVDLPRLLGVRVRVHGVVGGGVEEPDALGGRVHGAGERVHGTQVGGDVLGEGDVECGGEAREGALGALEAFICTGAPLSAGFLEELAATVEDALHCDFGVVWAWVAEGEDGVGRNVGGFKGFLKKRWMHQARVQPRHVHGCLGVGSAWPLVPLPWSGQKESSTCG